MTLVRCQRVWIHSSACLSTAGAAGAAWSAVAHGRSCLRQEPGIGWCGRIPLPTRGPSRLRMLIEAVVPSRPAEDPFPILAVSASKGDTGILLSAQAGPLFSWCPPGDLTRHLAGHLGITTYLPAGTAAACSTGLSNLLAAAELLERRRCGIGLVAVAEAGLQPLLLAGFQAMGVLCQERCPSAFQDAGTGFAPAEGAAALWLTTTPGPWRILGGLRLADASHATTCRDRQALVTLLQGLWELGPDPDLIVVHGTGTVAGDQYERQGLEAGPWKRCPRLAMKPCLGHCLGASGLVELVVAQAASVQRFWKLSLGFGGHLAGVAVCRGDGSGR